MKRWKRMTAALLVSCLLASLFPVGAAAAGTAHSVPAGTNLIEYLKNDSVKDGDTLQLQGNVRADNSDPRYPWIITKKIAIVGNGYNLTVSGTGIILGADVTFQNMNLSLISTDSRNAIIANGYALTLDNVKPFKGTRSINVFGGSLEKASYEDYFVVPTPGTAKTLTIRGKTNLQNGDSTDSMGAANIFAGSLAMGTFYETVGPEGDGPANTFSGNVTINIEDCDDSGALGTIYAGGAQQRKPYGQAVGKVTSPNPEKYKVGGTVTITGAKIPTVDGRGSDKTNVVYRGGGNQASLSFQAVSNLSVESGDLVLQAGSSFRDNTAAVGVASGAILNVKNLGNWTIGNFSGGGYLVMAANQTMTMAGTVSGQTAVAIDGMNYNKTQSTGIPTAGHTYIKAASSKDGDFTLLPYATMLDMELVRDDSGNWKASGDATETINRVTSFNIVPDTAAITMAEDAEIEMEATFETDVLPLLDFVPLIISVDGGRDLLPKEGDDGYYTYSHQGGVLNMTVKDDALCITPDRQYSAGTYKIQVTIPARYNATGSTLKDTVTLTVTDDSTPPDPDKPISISVPSAEQNLKYTGSEQTGVPEGQGYTINNNKATNAGNYTAEATPTSGYQWSDGTQETKKIPWSIAKADSPAAPTGLTGVAPTAAGKNDGKITGTTAAMEYSKDAGFSNSTTCTNGETAVSAGDYYVRFAESDNYNAGPAVLVTVPQGPVTVQSVAIATPASKTQYQVGEALDVTGLTLTVTMSDGNTYTVPVAAGMVSGFNSSAAAASQTLTVSYGGKTVTYNISVAGDSSSGGDDGDNGDGSGGDRHHNNQENRRLRHSDGGQKGRHRHNYGYRQKRRQGRGCVQTGDRPVRAGYAPRWGENCHRNRPCDCHARYGGGRRQDR